MSFEGNKNLKKNSMRMKFDQCLGWHSKGWNKIIYPDLIYKWTELCRTVATTYMAAMFAEDNGESSNPYFSEIGNCVCVYVSLSNCSNCGCLVSIYHNHVDDDHMWMSQAASRCWIHEYVARGMKYIPPIFMIKKITVIYLQQNKNICFY